MFVLDFVIFFAISVLSSTVLMPDGQSVDHCSLSLHMFTSVELSTIISGA
jgi:hypothetical protein